MLRLEKGKDPIRISYCGHDFCLGLSKRSIASSAGLDHVHPADADDDDRNKRGADADFGGDAPTAASRGARRLLE